MGGFRRRVLSLLLGPFVAGVGFCILLAPPPAAASACRATTPEPGGCCQRGAGGSCPAPERVPSGSRCQLCDGSLQLSAEEKGDPSAANGPHGSPPPVAAEADPLAAVADLRLDVLAVSPPFHLWNETFRN